MISLIRPNSVNGQKEQLEDWSQINWRQVNKLVKNLRQRIFRAKTLGQWKQLRRLQKLLLRSHANLLQAVRQITQLNAGKGTSGIDKEVFTTPEERVKLVNSWKEAKASPTRRVYIPKANGKKRPLGIPTVRDRVMQAIVKTTLEPEWEAIFEPNSYGFRIGRSCHDAIEQCFRRLNNGKDTWVLDADIKGFFDHIAHKTILNSIGTHPARELIKDWLKAGFIDEGILNPTETGTPQGGVISPLLANIGLHGLEEIVNSLPVHTVYEYTNKDTEKTKIAKRESTLGIIRYADDFVVTARDKESLEQMLILIKQWLSERGLEISAEKTRIVHISEGFNFLGFNIRQYDGKLLIKPQKDKVLQFCKKIGKTLKECASYKQDVLIKKLNPLLRGFANYYRGVVSKEIFSYIENRVWQYLWRWANRRHPNKGKKWVKNKYFRGFQGQNWTFMCYEQDRRGKEKPLVLYNIASTPIIRHVKVKGNASPDNPELREYWENRKTKQGKIHWAKGSKYEQIAKEQNWKCPTCGDHLFNGEEIETHHTVPVKEGGTDDKENLIHLHKACHKQVHGKSKSVRLEV